MSPVRVNQTPSRNIPTLFIFIVGSLTEWQF
jgi:hypothetical protein